MPPSRSADNRLLLRFLGKRFVVFSSLSFFGAVFGGVVDYWFAVVIQLFLFSMGLLQAWKPPLALPGADQPMVVGALLLGLGALRALFVFLQGYGSGVAQEQASSRVRAAAILRILPRDDRSRVAANEAFFIYSEISAKAAMYLSNVVKLLAAVLQTMVLGVAMLYLSWFDCVLAAGLLLLSSVVLLRLNVHIGNVAKRNPEIWTESVAALESAGRNWFYIRIKHLHDVERNRLNRLNADVQAIGFRMRRLTEVSPAVVSFLAVLILAVLANTRARVTHTPPAVFLSFLYVFLRFAQGLGECARGASGLVEFKPYLERLRALIGTLPLGDPAFGENADRAVSPWGRPRALPPVTTASPELRLVDRPATLRSPRVTLRGVSFRYDESGPFIIRQLDAEVANGSQLAIIGPSGCGKSTLLALILGFAKPLSGSIDIDGTAPERYCAQFAEYIGYVGPDPYIITGSVRDNVLFGSHATYSDEQLWRALSQAALADVIRALPAGLDTPLRHHDVALSMGQRQRLALARALLPQPALLVLDEASANLDDSTEEAIATSIRSLKGTTTTIIVSHKLGLVKHADEIIDMGAAAERRERDSRSAP